MEAMRQSWTDERLDDFREHVDQRFDQVERRFEQVDKRFEQVDRRFDRLESELKSQRQEIMAEIRSLYRMTLQVSAGIFGTLVLAILTVLASN
jgi:septal ring factor EnvC (AmiA/AmiB activator)